MDLELALNCLHFPYLSVPNFPIDVFVSGGLIFYSLWQNWKLDYLLSCKMGIKLHQGQKKTYSCKDFFLNWVQNFPSAIFRATAVAIFDAWHADTLIRSRGQSCVMTLKDKTAFFPTSLTLEFNPLWPLMTWPLIFVLSPLVVVKTPLSILGSSEGCAKVCKPNFLGWPRLEFDRFSINSKTFCSCSKGRYLFSQKRFEVKD